MNTDPGELWLGLELAAMQGDAASQAALGVMHYLGHDSASCRPIPQNLAEARRLLELAAAQGNSHAQAALDGLDWDAEDLVEAAPYEENGEGGPVDFTEARRLYEFAAAQGDTGARAALDTVNRVAEVQRAKEQACWNFAEATRLFKLAAAKGHAHLSGQCASEDMTEARRLYRLAASQGSAGAQEALDGLEVLDRAAEVHRAKKQAEADAMMEQLLAEDAEEKKAKGAAKSKKSAKGKKRASAAPPSAAASAAPVISSSSGTTVAVTAAPSNAAQRDAMPIAAGELESMAKSTKGAKGKNTKKKRGEPAASSVASTVAVEDSSKAQAILETMSVVPSSPAAEPTATHPSAPESAAPSIEPRAAAPVPVAPRGGGGHEQVPSAAATATSDDVVGAVAHLLGQASLQVPAGSSDAGAAAPVAAAPAAMVSLADAHFTTGRLEAPESTIGGQTTCIICFVNPKSHAAVPCGHQSACGDCSAKMTECPVCRKTALMWMHVRVA